MASQLSQNAAQYLASASKQALRVSPWQARRWGATERASSGSKTDSATPPNLSLTFGRQWRYQASTGRLQILTRATRQDFWVACARRLVWTAGALDRLLMRRPAQNVEDIIISSAHRCCRARVVRYCVAAELEEGEATTRWHLVKNPSTSFGTRYEGTFVPYYLA